MKDKFDKYNCPICQCILNYPVTLKKCFHEFCLKCIQSLIKTCIKNSTPLLCPLCRKEFRSNDYVIATDLQKEIENCTIKCNCGDLIPIQIFEDHQEKCNKKEKREDGSVKGNYNCVQTLELNSKNPIWDIGVSESGDFIAFTATEGIGAFSLNK